MIDRVQTIAMREGKTFAKFVLVGGASFLVYLSIYTLQSRVLFPGGSGASDHEPGGQLFFHPL